MLQVTSVTLLVGDMRKLGAEFVVELVASCHCDDNIQGNQLRRAKVYLGSQFQQVGWLHCYRPVVRLNILVTWPCCTQKEGSGMEKDVLFTDTSNEKNWFLLWGLLRFKNKILGWWDGSVGKSTDCSSKGPEFKSQQPHGGSQPLILRSDALFWCIWRQLQCTYV